MDTAEKDWLHPVDAARRAGVSRERIYELAQLKQVTTKKSPLRISADSLNRWLTERDQRKAHFRGEWPEEKLSASGRRYRRLRFTQVPPVPHGKPRDHKKSRGEIILFLSAQGKTLRQIAKRVRLSHEQVRTILTRLMPGKYRCVACGAQTHGASHCWRCRKQPQAVRCQDCGALFPPDRTSSTYCSLHRAPLIRPCIICGTPITRKRTSKQEQAPHWYCSKRCQGVYVGKSQKTRKEKNNATL